MDTVHKLVSDKLNMLGVNARSDNRCLKNIRQLLGSGWKLYLRMGGMLRWNWKRVVRFLLIFCNSLGLFLSQALAALSKEVRLFAARASSLMLPHEHGRFFNENS